MSGEAWLVIDQGKKALAKPYGRQYLLFATESEMFKYVEAAGYVGHQAALSRDIGMVNFYEVGDINLKFVRLEVK